MAQSAMPGSICSEHGISANLGELQVSYKSPLGYRPNEGYTRTKGLLRRMIEI